MVIAAAAVVVVGLAVGLTVWLTNGSSEPAPPTHQAYQQLFTSAVVRQTRIAVLDKWPKPYQTYHDSYKHQCYEWWDKPVALYSLCFKDGTLVNKDIL